MSQMRNDLIRILIIFSHSGGIGEKQLVSAVSQLFTQLPKAVLVVNSQLLGAAA